MKQKRLFFSFKDVSKKNDRANDNNETTNENRGEGDLEVKYSMFQIRSVMAFISGTVKLLGFLLKKKHY